MFIGTCWAATDLCQADGHCISQAAEEQYVHVLPPTSLSVKVSFYDSEPGQLAELFPVVQALLRACPKPRRHESTAELDLCKCINCGDAPIALSSMLMCD